MKVRTIKDVNIREGSPSPTARKKGVIFKDFVLDVEPVDGVVHEGVRQWYRDQNGDFIWGGAVEPSVAPAKPFKFPDSPVDWRKMVKNLPSGLDASGVRVAILDSGMDFSHPALGHVDSRNAANLCGSADGTTDMDEDSHGTHCAGLIAARLLDGQGIQGVAPGAEIFVGKVMHENIGHSLESVAAGIEWARKAEVHVINMSLRLTGTSVELENAAKLAAEAKIIMVAAAGENGYLLATAQKRLTSILQSLVVGTINQKHLNDRPGARYNKQLDYLVPGISMESCCRVSLGGYLKQSGSSMASALVSGVVALLIKQLGFVDHRPDDYLQQLTRAIDDLAVSLKLQTDLQSFPLPILKPTY